MSSRRNGPRRPIAMINAMLVATLVVTACAGSAPEPSSAADTGPRMISEGDVQLEWMSESSLDNLSPAVGWIVPAPGGGVLVLNVESGKALWLRDPERGGATPVDGVAPPVLYLGGGDRFALLFNESGSVILDDEGAVRHRFARRAISPIGGAVVAGDRLFVLGMARSGDPRTGSGDRLSRCLLATVLLDRDDSRAEGVVCGDAPIDIASWSIYAGGHLRAGGGRVYAVWDGSPDLHVLHDDGRLLRKIRIAEGEDAPPRVTMADRERVLAQQGGYFLHRGRYRWAQGTLEVPGGGFAVLFREPASREHAFTMDIYSDTGDRLARSLPMDLGLRSPGTFARPVTVENGRQYIMVYESDETFRKPKEQRLYRVTFGAPGAER